MPRKTRPDWTEIILHMPKRHRGLHCLGGWFGKGATHYVKSGHVWRCDRCFRIWLCDEHWPEHQNEHMIRELAEGGVE